MSEISYRSLNGTRQTRSSFTNNDLKEQPITDIPTVGSLTSEMIAQYKREEEEQNRYVDPTSGNEFKFAPAGTAPTLNAPAYVVVPSLGAPATITDLKTEETNFAKILEHIRDKNKEIEEKEKEIKAKEEENTEYKTKLKELKKKLIDLNKERTETLDKVDTEQKLLADLEKLTSPTTREEAKIRRLKVAIPRLKTKLTNIEAQMKTLRSWFFSVGGFKEWVDGWAEGWMDGEMGGWRDG
jgi:Skp family chaperone for outer membrane proteins